MTVLALTNAFSFVHGYDFSTDLNKLQLNAEATALDSTTFGATYRSMAGGLKSWNYDMAGYWQSATSQAVDPESFPDLATAGRVFTVGADQTAGTACYMGQGGKFSYMLGGSLGELMPFSLSSTNTDRYGLIRGQVAKAKGSVAATGALGSSLNLGAVGSTQYLYATFHAFSVGTTVTVIVESSADNTFGSPTTRISFTGVTTVGGTWGTRVAGAITDTWYRMKVSAITGTFSVAGAIGIQ